MSVITRKVPSSSTQLLDVFVKGAPEIIEGLCNPGTGKVDDLSPTVRKASFAQVNWLTDFVLSVLYYYYVGPIIIPIKN